ncbi:MAG: hypothetical protein BGO77_03520 [Caedibacter sp. 37-49]|nr:MAG: hypothetical protein BGO77_03520 [Caedibacter sp. 37-49]
MILSYFKLLLHLSFIYFVITPIENCWGSAIDTKEDSEKRNFPKKALPEDKIYNEKIDLEEAIRPLRDNLIFLTETPPEIRGILSFKIRKQRKIPSLKSFRVSYVPSQFIEDITYLENFTKSLCNKSGKQIECIFACDSEELFCYQELFKVKSRLSDNSKIVDIKKAMFFYKSPIVVALAISKKEQSILTKLLVVYEFNDENLAFSARDLLKGDNSPSLVLTYTILQLFAFEAWVPCNVNLINHCA